MIQTAIELTIKSRDIGRNILGGLVDLRFTPPNNPVSREVASNVPIEFDVDTLLKWSLDPSEYGKILKDMLFANTYLWKEWEKTYAYTQGLSSREAAILRFWLRLDLPFHWIRWETLPNPITSAPLSFSERILFSRYFDSAELAPIHIPDELNLKVLSAVSNPDDLSDFGLATIDVAGEQERISNACADGGIPIQLISSSVGKRVNLNNLMEELRGGCNILYLACHGVQHRRTGETRLFLENEDGSSAIISGPEFVQGLENLQTLPSLVILASCQTAAFESETSGVSIGPLMASAGVPAVIAMQGHISLSTVAKFMPIFLKELVRTGRVDHAVAIARTNIRNETDWWMPVLFMRVWDGKLWRESIAEAPTASKVLPREGIRSRADRLRELKQLYEDELITSEEFEAKKASILSEL